MNPILLANVMAPYVAWGIGNDTEIILPFSMLATLLAAVIERPFTTAAGFQTHAFLHSARANILSWFLGLVLAYTSLFVDRKGTLFAAMIYLSIPFSIAIEGAYLSIVRKVQGGRLAWKPIAIGNLLSGIVLVAVSTIGHEWGNHLQITRAPVIRLLRQHRAITSTTILCACIATFLLIMFVPTRSSNEPSEPKSDEHVERGACDGFQSTDIGKE